MARADQHGGLHRLQEGFQRGSYRSVVRQVQNSSLKTAALEKRLLCSGLYITRQQDGMPGVGDLQDGRGIVRQERIAPRLDGTEQLEPGPAQLPRCGFQLKSLFDRKKKGMSEGNNVIAEFRLLIERGVRLLLVYSEGDPGLDFFQMILGDEIHELTSNGRLKVEIIKRVDHTFTPLSSQENLLEAVGNWARATA